MRTRIIIIIIIGLMRHQCKFTKAIKPIFLHTIQMTKISQSSVDLLNFTFYQKKDLLNFTANSSYKSASKEEARDLIAEIESNSHGFFYLPILPWPSSPL